MVKANISQTMVILAVICYSASSHLDAADGWSVEVRTADAYERTESRIGAEPIRLSVLNRALIHIRENYVDPKRIQPKRMVVSALESIETEIDELLIDRGQDPETVPDAVTVRLGSRQQSFSMADVQNLWTLSFKLKDVLRFITQHSTEKIDDQDVEYAAINGLLATLDPHSRLLRPEDYREMRLSTQGKFGGLGIVINLEDGVLTVVRPIPNTPAERAGVRSGDQIVQINLDSTVNMGLDEAVDLLRGEPDTTVDLWIRRKGWQTPRRFVLRRADVKVKSVVSRRLGQGIAIARLNNFQSTTAFELKTALETMRQKDKTPLKGLILDLRGNPGGLLEQAIKVADLFVVSGPLVTTVGFGDKMREPKMATRKGTMTQIPMVVLIDGSSASASEIVAGALKNHHRALVLGERSFGKGSVQVIYDNRDESALKLTIAQYLTPGDESIQSVGVTPDIAARGLLVDGENVDLFPGRDSGEAALKRHLVQRADSKAPSAKPSVELAYLRDLPLERKIERDPDALHVDFQVDLAQAILVATKAPDRAAMMASLGSVIQAREAQAQAKLIEALNDLGVDWSPYGTGSARPPAEPFHGRASWETDADDNRVRSGETLKLTIKVQNDGSWPIHRLYAVTECDNEQFDDREFPLGLIGPGDVQARTLPFPVALDTLGQRIRIRVRFKSLGAEVLAPMTIPVEIVPQPLPNFGLTHRFDDTKTGNGDGLVQLGEDVELVVQTRNFGEGRARRLVSSLRRAPDAPTGQVFLKRGRTLSSALAPGDVEELRFEFKVQGMTPTVAAMRLGVGDPKHGVYAFRDVHVRAFSVNKRLEAEDKRLLPSPQSPISIYAQPSEKTAAIGWVKGVTLGRPGVPGWYRMTFSDGFFGWIRAADVVEASDEGPLTLPEYGAMPTPMRIRVRNESKLKITTRAMETLVGDVSSEDPIRDLRIYVNRKKVFFKSAKQALSRNLMRFSVQVPLTFGLNRIDFIARSERVPSHRQTIIIDREPLK
ncbi:MAG: MXAN_5808 family serine peptidase [Myxococcota bacterium]|nr:MXAN_5808 family serine peptidase [Myxococcota bacterium]